MKGERCEDVGTGGCSDTQGGTAHRPFPTTLCDCEDRCGDYGQRAPSYDGEQTHRWEYFSRDRPLTAFLLYMKNMYDHGERDRREEARWIHNR